MEFEITKKTPLTMFEVSSGTDTFLLVLTDTGDVYPCKESLQGLSPVDYDAILQMCQRELKNPTSSAPIPSFEITGPIEGDKARRSGPNTIVYEFTVTFKEGKTLYTLELDSNGREVSRSKSVNKLPREIRRLLLEACQEKLLQYLS